MKQSLYTLATRFVTEMKAICRTLTAKKLNLTTQPSTKVKRGNPIQYGPANSIIPMNGLSL